MIEAGRALAFLRGRDYVLPEDVIDLAPDVLRHRLVALLRSAGRRHDAGPASCTEILQAVPAPEKPLEAHVRSRRERRRRC